jgi:Ser/Thr protein kinase RdoA (MazF antagonist)
VDRILEELQERARAALAEWGLPLQEPELLKYRENAVFKVRLADGGKAALRLHRPGYHSEQALLSELQWMDDLRRNGQCVPQPIATGDGRLLVGLDGGEKQFADLIGWVDGVQLGETGKPFAHARDRIVSLFHAVGAAMAEMHNVSDRWTPPANFSRSAWDAGGLLGEAPVWGRFWDCAGVSAEDREFLARLRANLIQRLQAISSDLDYGLIHADLVRENVLVSGDRIAMIDFDDCGYGWRLFDIATALLRNRREPHYPLIKASLLEGYRSKRALSHEALAHLPLFLTLRSLTYIGWAGERSELPDSAARMIRYVKEARELADAL